MALPERILPGHTVRRLWPGDRAAVLDYFLRLDPETRADRFMGGVSEAGVRAYAEHALITDGLVVGAFADGVLRGLGELRPVDARAPGFMLGSEAEAAFAVEADFRRRGIGTALFGRIARAARNRGVGTLQVRCLARNRPMIRLAARLGAEVRSDGRESRGDVRLAQPDPVSLWYESIAEAYDFTVSLVYPAKAEARAEERAA